jgi:hypothetical protein
MLYKKEDKIQEHRNEYEAYTVEHNVAIQTVKANYIQHIING